MILLLELDRIKQAASRSAAERAGLLLHAVDHEDQLAQVDLSAVNLVVVGRDWPEYLLNQLRASGLHCPCIYATSTAEHDSAYRIAKERGWVDVVTYPLPMEYLRRWIRAEEPEGTQVDPSPPLTPLEAILKRNGPRKQDVEVVQKESDQPPDDPEAAMRGRVVCIHSARGGVGKSTLTALLARSLSKQGVSVGVIDLDPKGNLLAIHHQSATMTTDDFTRLPAQMDETAFKESLVAVEDWYLLPSGRVRDGLDDRTLRQVVHQFCRYFDFTLIDTSPSAVSTYTALGLADRAVFVMTPEWMAFKRFLEEYELVRHMKTPERVVVAVNRIRKKVSEHRRAIRLLDEAHLPSDRVYIPEDHRLYRDLMTASPLAGSKKVSDAMDHLLGALRISPTPKRPRPKLRIGQIREVMSK